MHWSIPIFSAVVGVIGGWLIRHFYDARVERALLRRELFKEYMRLVADGLPGLNAIQRVGALRLPKKEFDMLVADVTRCGRPPESVRDVGSTRGIAELYDFLLFAASQETEVSPGIETYHMLVKMKVPDSDKATPEENQRALARLRR
jgi:hypothetical protein